MTTQKLYYTKYFCPQTLQILIGSQFVGKKLQLNEYNKKYDTVSLITQKGVLNKSNAILRYISLGTNLYPKNQSEINQLNTWFEFFNTQLYPLLVQIYGQIFGQKLLNQTKYKYSIDQINKNLKIFDDYLKIKSFFIGHNITIFDISLICYLQNLFKLIITQADRKKFTNLTRWYNYIRQIPFITKFYGKKILCANQAFKIDFKTKQQLKQKVFEQKQVKANKKQQKKQKQDKKQNKTVQAKVVQTVPISQSTFKLDDWKRQFQNSQNKVQVINKLLENFQKQHWSIWKIHYLKDVTEGKILHITNNLANGTLQRLQTLRKTGFGSWGVYGQQGDYQIRGIMMWKGTDKHEAWKQHPSVEYHLFLKLDIENQDDKKLILEYWTQKQSAEGLIHRSSKIIV